MIYVIPSKIHLKFENVTWVLETALDESLLLNGLYPSLTQNIQGEPKARGGTGRAHVTQHHAQSC